MTGSGRLATMGTSPRAIRHHYDLSDDFFQIWLGPDMVYSCGWWEAGDGPDSLAQAQHRKLDFFADRLGVRGARVLDVGCGWGALLDRFVRVHGAASGVGLTLSPSQAGFAARRNVPGVSYLLQNWTGHEPGEPYDAVTCIEATEHFASETLTPDEKVEVYRAFFERAASWLRPGGRMGLQLICLDNLGHADGPGPEGGRSPTSSFRTSFPSRCPRRCLSSYWAGRRTSNWMSSTITPATTGGPSAPGRSPTGNRRRSRVRWSAQRPAAPTRGTSRSVRPSSGSASTRCTASSSPSGPSPRPGPSPCARATSRRLRTQTTAAGRRLGRRGPLPLRRVQLVLRAVAGPHHDVLLGHVGGHRDRGRPRARPAAEDRLLRGPGAAQRGPPGGPSTSAAAGDGTSAG